MRSRPLEPHETGHTSHPGIYDRIGVGYAGQRRPDPRIARRIWAALGSARRVLNVGAGAGSYEPTDRSVIALEPSRRMIAQRGSGLVLRGVAEALPFRAGEFDAALAVLTVHHWEDAAAGLAELRRVADRVVIFTFDPWLQDRFWFVREYVPAALELEGARSPSIDDMVSALGSASVESVPVPHDCTDGFQAAYWRRPERYLDPAVRAAISTFAQLPADQVEPGVRRLEEDLASGRWIERHRDLLSLEEQDYGYRLIVAS